jgi:3-oxoacyl-[acyl-carrier-protein] synthase-3
MQKITAAITSVGGYVPEDLLTNEDLEKMVDTNDEPVQELLKGTF